MINRLLKHGALFVLAKSIVLIAPLFAAYLLDKSSYGLFEWSLSIAMIISTVITLGAGNTIAFEKVKNEQSALIYIGQTYSVYLSFILAFLSIIIAIFFHEVSIVLVLGMSSFFVVQYALSAYMKASGLGARASIIDSGIYIVLLILLMLALFQEDSKLPYVVSFSIFAMILGVFLNSTIDRTTTVTKNEIRKFLKRGFPIMLSGGMVIFFFNLPKMLLGSESMVLVGEFSLYFRWAAMALVVYQFIIVMFFRDLYTKSYPDFDKFIASISLGIYILGFFILTFLYLANAYEVKYLPLPDLDISVQVLMIAIIALWTLTASLEGLLYREDKSIHQLWANLLGIIIFLIIYNFHQDDKDTIYLITSSWLISFAAIIFYQLFIIHKFILKAKFTFINSFFVLILVITIFLSEIKV
ncbi:hypothetical protein [Sulfurovum sp.]|uniref:hypothetical protein n=1 Tax=Sulfurovum sp. TaxID=1969726 RepID=UPI003562375F